MNAGLLALIVICTMVVALVAIMCHYMRDDDSYGWLSDDTFQERVEAAVAKIDMHVDSPSSEGK